MDNTSQFQSLKSNRPHRKLLVFIAISAVALVGLSFAAVFVISNLQQASIKNQLETALIDASKEMQKAEDAGDGYPVSVLATPQSKNVTLSGGGSFDGTSYCITATLISDNSVQYYIDSSSKVTRTGSCDLASDLPKPGAPGIPSVSMVGPTQISLTWKSASYASNYTVQCSTDETFTSNVTSVESKTLAATCNDLKSGESYFVRIRAENTQDGDWSEVLTAETTKLPSARP